MGSDSGFRSGKGDFSFDRFEIGGSAPSQGGQYPRKYETKIYGKEGAPVFIRPIKSYDGPRLIELFKCLSPQSVFYRFLRELDSLPSEWVDRFTHIDYNRDVAMVAVERSEAGEKMLGVCRIMRSPGSVRGEIAVVVVDAWQGRGIGTRLIEISMNVARDLGIRAVWGLVSANNTQVLRMAEKMGFAITKDEDAGLCELEIALAPRR